MPISKRTIKRIRTVASKLENAQPEFNYYEYIAMHYSVDSTLELTEVQAEDAIQAMDRELKAIKRAKQPDRKPGFITPRQKEYLEGLFDDLGWTNVNRQIGFINKQIGRKCTVDMLRNREASKVISGLERVLADEGSANADGRVQSEEVEAK